MKTCAWRFPTSTRSWRTGLRVACGVLTLASTLLVGQAAHAAGPTPRQVAAALNKATSYQMLITASGAESGTYAITLTVVGAGTKRTIYLQVVGRPSFSVVARGNTTCVNLAGQWLCTSSPTAEVSALLSFNPSTMLQEYGASFHFTGSGVAKTIGGQQAVGYSFYASSASIGASRGTLWLSPTTARIIEEDATLSSPLVTGKAATYTVKVVSSHWNDPKLTIPSVPGL